ncbi:hypothetical protein SteCoe_14567 [Stentor coeruleus]|uniref:Arf-GAP domain-containing protein n=1 Tax=Stentor coeruleus TaxID=5963 RepID=A0A1R2C5N9_9CILI|nr:hypothetical protein SteCoe_14567 [Stentor coeruleus]
MTTEQKKKVLLIDLQKDSENLKCIDCHIINPNCISFGFGCFICSSCANFHSTLGPNVTTIKTLDQEWSYEEIEIMSSGGNSALKEFFNYYDLMDAPSNIRYNTIAAEFYRDMLVSVTKNPDFDLEFPLKDDGIQIIQTLSGESNEFRFNPRIAQPLLRENNEKSKICECLRKSFMRIAFVGNMAAERINEKVGEISEKPYVKKAEEKTSGVFHSIENKVTGLIKKVKENERIQVAGKHMSNAAGRLARGVKYRYYKFRGNTDKDLCSGEEKHGFENTESSFMVHASTNEISGDSLLMEENYKNGMKGSSYPELV